MGHDLVDKEHPFFFHYYSPPYTHTLVKSFSPLIPSFFGHCQHGNKTSDLINKTCWIFYIEKVGKWIKHSWLNLIFWKILNKIILLSLRLGSLKRSSSVSNICVEVKLVSCRSSDSWMISTSVSKTTKKEKNCIIMSLEV